MLKIPDSHTTTDVKPEMEFHMINIIYAALSICTKTEKMTFSFFLLFSRSKVVKVEW